jgi:hypothetical protein
MRRSHRDLIYDHIALLSLAPAYAWGKFSDEDLQDLLQISLGPETVLSGGSS